MNSILRNNSTINAIRMMVSILCVAIVAACGGGGGSAGTTVGNTGNTVTSSLTLVLTDSNGAAKTTITAGSPILAKATIKTSTGTGVAGVIVTFASSSAIATISPVTGTAITDANGVAQVTVQGGVGSGAATVSATALVDGVSQTQTANFSVGASDAAAINFTGVVPSSKSIVIKGSGGNGRTEVALLTFTVVDSTNTGVFNKKVNFQTTSTEAVTLVNSTGTTAADGTVTVAINSGSKPTTVRVTATVEGTAITAISDTVTVTTGQPVQTAFSMSLEKYAIEGWNWDNTKQKVLILMADAFGGAVADGTQVVFTTNGGAIVGTGGSACLTTQGECSVDWRSQDPRPVNGINGFTGKSGVVTVTATATNGTQNLTTSLRFYMSGSFGYIYEIAPICTGPQNTQCSIEGNTYRSSNGIAPRSFINDCSPQTMDIEVVDVNGNPMPTGTALGIVNPILSSATIFPATIDQTPQFFDADTRGTLHHVTITPTGCDLTATGTKSGGFDISVTTPKSGVTYTHVDLSIKSN